MIGLAYCDKSGRIYFDATKTPLADAGIVRETAADEVIPAPRGTMPMVLPGRRPLTREGTNARRLPLAVALPAGYTRLLLPAYEAELQAPALPLFGYTFACERNGRLHVAAMRTDESEDWRPRFSTAALERRIAERIAREPQSMVLRQLARCSREYGCFTAQNVFLHRGEAALPVSPACNARCIGCISKLEPPSELPSPQERLAFEASPDDLARVGAAHLQSVEHGVVSFGQGCEGEPLLRSQTIARAIEGIRFRTDCGTINLNTNGSMPSALRRCIDAGLQALRVSLNSFRSHVYAEYYRPAGYGLDDVLESIELARSARLRVSLNLLTHPGVTDEAEEVAACTAFLRSAPVDMVQTRTLNIDPQWYFDAVGRPQAPLGMRAAIAAIRSAGVRVGNFTHSH